MKHRLVDKGLGEIMKSAEHQPFTVIAWASAIAHAMESLGGDSEGLFKGTGIPYNAASNPEALLLTSDVSRLFESASIKLDDPNFGLRVALHVNLCSFHALGYSLFSSSDLANFCVRLITFFRFHSDNVTHSLEKIEGGFRLNVHQEAGGISTIAFDAWLASLVQFCRLVYRPNFSPREIEIGHPLGCRSLTEFQKFFRCPVRFGMPGYGIKFSDHDMSQPLSAFGGNLGRRNVELVVHYLGRLHASDILARTEGAIIELLPTGRCTMALVAESLGMTERTLQYRLEAHGRSYSAILDDLRKKLALQYVTDGSVTPTEVSSLLGFSCGASFTRAFRRWTGVPPSRYISELCSLTSQSVDPGV